jgi:hypothetical protein
MIITASSRLTARRARDSHMKASRPARQLSVLGYARENSAARLTWSSLGRTPV